MLQYLQNLTMWILDSQNGHKTYIDSLCCSKLPIMKKIVSVALILDSDLSIRLVENTRHKYYFPNVKCEYGRPQEP